MVPPPPTGTPNPPPIRPSQTRRPQTWQRPLPQRDIKKPRTPPPRDRPTRTTAARDRTTWPSGSAFDLLVVRIEQRLERRQHGIAAARDLDVPRAGVDPLLIERAIGGRRDHREADRAAERVTVRGGADVPD